MHVFIIGFVVVSSSNLCKHKDDIFDKQELQHSETGGFDL